MKKLYKHLTIRNLFFLIAVFVAVIVIVFGIYVIVRFSDYFTSIQNNYQINSIKNNISAIEKTEKEIISIHKDSLFLDFSENSMPEKLNKLVDETKNQIQSAIENRSFSNSQLKKLTRLQRDFESYSKLHKTSYEVSVKIGNEHTGLIHNITTAYNIFRKSAIHEDNTSKELISALHKNISNFLTYKDYRFYQHFKSEFSELSKRLNITDTINLASNFERNKLYNQAVEYKSYFDLLIDKYTELGIINDSGLYLEIFDALQRTITNIEIIQQQLLTETEKESTTKGIIIFMLFIIISGLITIYFFTHFIVKKTNAIVNYTKQLSEGILPEPIKLKSINEFIQISDLYSKISSDLQAKAKFIENIGNGKFDEDYSALSEKDTLGNVLLEMRKNLLNAKQDEEKKRNIEDIQDKIAQGLANLSDILRENIDDINKMSYEIIVNLVKFLRANQGSIYIYTDDNPDDIHLQLTACYAYDKRKYLQKKIKLGEGLVGVCAVEKTTTCLENIPEDYIHITSGFGKSNPRALLLVPLLLSKNVLGVIEIASFQNFEKHEIEFMEKAADDIATTLSYVKINLKTALLLKQMQIQAEEMTQKEKTLLSKIEELNEQVEHAQNHIAQKQNTIDRINKESSEEIQRFRVLSEELKNSQIEINELNIQLENEKIKLLADNIQKNREINHLRKRENDLTKMLDLKQKEVEQLKTTKTN